MKKGYVYIMTNYNRTTFYTGVTNNLGKRVEEHRRGIGSVFTRKYNLNILVYYEELPSMYSAIVREKQIKNWHRDWKLNADKIQHS
ncbi:MAG: GIY-YIG nuclease family protein [Bacteroidota bacterium]|nr:GIY-YIG nuclease family protein [Bacteroidota bacterium]